MNNLNAKKLHFTYYIGVLRGPSMMYRYLASLILAYFTGDIDTTVSRANCTGELNFWMLFGKASFEYTE